MWTQLPDFNFSDGLYFYNYLFFILNLVGRVGVEPTTLGLRVAIVSAR